MVNCLSTAPVNEELVAQCLKNDSKAQRQLYGKLAPRMFALCLRYCNDRETAEDVLQEGFVTLFAKLHTYKGEGSFEGWARRIFVTAALMHLRKRDVLKYAEDVQQAGHDVPYEPGIVEKMDSMALLKIVSQMPAGFRTVFNMFVVEGYSHLEIAQELGITESGSRSQLSRAKNWLKERLGNNEF